MLQPLSEEFILDYHHRLHRYMSLISRWQDLSQDFIEKNIKILDFNELRWHNKFTPYLKRKYNVDMKTIPKCKPYSDILGAEYQPCGHRFHPESILDLVILCNK